VTITPVTAATETIPILLIEDDLSLSGSLSQFLTENGYRTISCTTVRRGWELVNSTMPRVLLLDLNLPDGSGLDLLRKIAQNHLPVRVVVMTAFDLHHVRPVHTNGSLAGWLTKPVNPLELLKIIDREMGAAPAMP
jgi:DNA-binding response OmpR family regulator